VDPRVATLLDSISETRLGEILQKLASFETRNTLSAADSPTRGIGAARQWILEEMRRSSPRLQVAFDTYEVLKQGERITRDVELRNVMAVLPGRSPRRVYVSGHYDSLARRVEPGAPAARSAGGGFDWWGKGEPFVWLSAYALQEFSDMAKVYPIDRGVIDRTQKYLMKQMEPDGTWSKIGATHGETIASRSQTHSISNSGRFVTVIVFSQIDTHERIRREAYGINRRQNMNRRALG
jgi:hypothetical protein